MFTSTCVMILMIVDLSFVMDINCAQEFKVGQLEIGATGRIRCAYMEIDPKGGLVHWYKSRTIDTFENGDPSLASWIDGIIESQPNYHMDNSFSLVIINTTLEDEGLYRCSVLPGDSSAKSHHYTRTFMYGLPRMDPVITLDTDLNRVNCTVEHVKPLIYPVLNFDYSHASIETNAVLNRDGTYTTSVSCALPQTKSMLRVDCYFSYLCYQRVVSSGMRDINTESLMRNNTTTVSPMGTSVTFADNGCMTTHRTPIEVWGIVISLLTVGNVIVLIVIVLSRRLTLRSMQKCDEVKENEVKMIQPVGDTVVEVTT